MRRILPLILSASVLVPALTAVELPTPPMAEPKPVNTKPLAQPKPAVEVTTPEVKPALELQATAPGSVIVALAKTGNVRFGPSTNAKIAITLKVGQQIEVLGPAQNVRDWFLVRMPREASAWMHSKVLTPQDGGKTFIVNEDRAKARDDATLRSSILAEVAKGEIVEAKGRQVGDWHAVYIPSSTAYVSRIVLAMNPKLDAMLGAQVVETGLLDLSWQAAQKRYDAYLAALKKDLETAAILDWTHLSLQLGEVAEKHPDHQVQAAAQRMKDGIAKVVRAAEKVQRDNKMQPVLQVPGEPPIADPSGEPAVLVKTPDTNPGTTTVSVPPANVVAPGTPAAPAAPGSKLDPALSQGIPEVVLPTIIYPATGYIEEKSFPQVACSYVVMDENQNILAFLKPKAGSTLQLNEYFWNYVGVKGEKSKVDQTKHTLGKDIPLIEVEDVVLLRR